ncbi:MAG: diphosphate--fructose-6-phosphate 1-phosphotransferase, partial [Waddliaceae bacterium]|nr:diphosphate--fructose-6-phosphate 1-phosphotransferase [Waddliaceae bacterium]
MSKSPLHQARLSYAPKLPLILQEVSYLEHSEGESTSAAANVEALKNLFACTFGQPLVLFNKGERRECPPLRVGVLLSGGQASGGHNVIAGIFDALKALNPDSVLYGFLKGPNGIIDNDTIEITAELLEGYRNQGGFDMIASSRTKIETKEQFESSLKTVRDLSLDGVVIIGGDDSNTNAAMLAEYFESSQCRTRVIGVPKTIDG